MSLCLHTGAYEVNLQQLETHPVPNPTATWMPVKHLDLINIVKDSLFRTGYEITDESHALAYTDIRDNYFGLMDLKSPFVDHTITVGLRNSNSMQFPAGLVIGNRVFVCDNLAFSGEVHFARKHTTHILRDLPQLVDSSIGKISKFTESQELRIENYKETELNVKEVDHALMSILRARILPANKIVDVLKEFDHPSHEEFKKDGSTLWRLYNACTEHMKNSIWLLPRRTMALHGILDGFLKAPLEGQLV